MNDITFKKKDLQDSLMKYAAAFFEDCMAENEDSTSHKIRMLINEAYGVAEEVESTTIELKKYIESSIDNMESPQNIYDGKFQCKCFGRDINIKCAIYDFDNIDKFKSSIFYEKMKSWFNPDEEDKIPSLTLNLISINKKLTVDSEDTIQHELQHFYEYVKKNGKPLMSDRYDKLYKICRNTYKRRFEDTGDEELNKQKERDIKILDAALYASFNNEINAFLNSFDSLLRNIQLNPNSDIYNSIVYKSLNLIGGVLNDWSKYENLIGRAYGVKPYICFNMLKNAWNRYCRGIARLLVKHKRIDDKRYKTMIHDRNWFGPWSYMFNKIDENIKNGNYKNILI